MKRHQEYIEEICDANLINSGETGRTSRFVERLTFDKRTVALFKTQTNKYTKNLGGTM